MGQSGHGGPLKPPAGLCPQSQPLSAGSWDTGVLAEALCSSTYFLAALQLRHLPCTGVGAVGSRQLLFVAFSYLLLGKRNGVLERSSVMQRVCWRGCSKGTCAPPAHRVTWQAGTCKNKFYT